MFVAAKSNFEIELFKMTLKLLVDKQDVPTTLKDYFNKVIYQAKKLAKEPAFFSPDILPEAIDLAFEIKSFSKVNQNLAKVKSFENLTPAKASNLLKNLESSHCL